MEDFIKNKNQWLPTWPENVEDRAMVVCVLLLSTAYLMVHTNTEC
jgi:hypothetical protein